MMKKCLLVAGGAVSAPLLKKIFRREEFAYVFAVDRGLEALDACGIRPTHLVGDFDSVAPEVLEKYLPGHDLTEKDLCSDRTRTREAAAEKTADEVQAGTERETACYEEVYPVLERLLPEKDDTDTEHAMRRAVALNPDEIILVGGFGTRFDHVLANVHTLIIPVRAGIPACMVDETNRIRLLEGAPMSAADQKDVRSGGERTPCGSEGENAGGEKWSGPHSEKKRNGAGNLLRIKKSEVWGDYLSLLPLTTEVSGITLEGFQYPLTDGVFKIGETVSLGVSNELAAEEGVIQIRKGILAVIESSDDGRAATGCRRRVIS